MRSFFVNILIGFSLLTSSVLLPVDLFAAEKSIATDGNVVEAESKLEKVKALSGSGLSDPAMAGNLIQTTLGLLVVLLVIGAAAWAFKRFGNIHVGAQGRMKIIGGISLGSRERAVLLQVGDQQLVVGVSPGRIQTLHVLENPVQVEEKPASSTSFSSRLQTAILSRKSGVDAGEKK